MYSFVSGCMRELRIYPCYLSFKMKTVKIHKEEFDINLEEISKAEKLYGKQLPLEYKEFLLRNNGGISYPSHPSIKTHKDYELWNIEMFNSIGDIIVNKHQSLNSEYPIHEDYELAKYNLRNEDLLLFALGERGWYFMDLSTENSGQLYFCNYSDGDGIVRIETKSFNEFLNSLTLPVWSEDEFDPNFEFHNIQYSSNKIFRSHLYATPFNPEIGLEHFKNVFKYFGDKQPEKLQQNVIQYYVNDRLKLKYLLDQKCSTEGLLNFAYYADTVKYLVEVVKLDINKIYNGRYPLQNYLSFRFTGEIKNKYLLVDELLELGIDFNWSLTGKIIDGKSDKSMIEKLRELHLEYLKDEIKDKKYWIENENPERHIPFKRSKLIEEKLNNHRQGNWMKRKFKR